MTFPLRIEMTVNFVACGLPQEGNDVFVSARLEMTRPLKIKSASSAILSKPCDCLAKLAFVLIGSPVAGSIEKSPGKFEFAPSGRPVAGSTAGCADMRKDSQTRRQIVPKVFILPNPVYFTTVFCLSQDMDAALPPLTAGPSPKQGGYGLASSTLYLVATPLRRQPNSAIISP